MFLSLNKRSNKKGLYNFTLTQTDRRRLQDCLGTHRAAEGPGKKIDHEKKNISQYFSITFVILQTGQVSE